MNQVNPFSLPEPWSIVSDGYSETTMHYLGQFADQVLNSIPLNTEYKVADIACGPGTVTRKIHSKVSSVDALDFSPEMIRILQNYLSKNRIGNVAAIVGDGQSLPFKNNEYDLAISMFGLMFFPDRPEGFAEAYRILKPGARVLVASWAPISESPAMKLMFGAIRAINPAMPTPQAVVENLENPAVFERELKAAGFREVSIQKMTESMTLESPDSFWADMEAGSVPITVMKHRSDPALWDEKRQTALAFIRENGPQFPTTLASTAWIGTRIK